MNADGQPEKVLIDARLLEVLIVMTRHTVLLGNFQSASFIESIVNAGEVVLGRQTDYTTDVIDLMNQLNKPNNNAKPQT